VPAEDELKPPAELPGARDDEGAALLDVITEEVAPPVDVDDELVVP